ERARAAHGHRLEVLRAHHRAEARAPDGPPVLAVDHDRREADESLAGRSDARHAWQLAAPIDCRADLGPDGVVGLEGVLAPQVAGVADLDLAIVDPQVDGPLGTSAHDDGVEAGLLEVVSPMA